MTDQTTIEGAVMHDHSTLTRCALVPGGCDCAVGEREKAEAESYRVAILSADNSPLETVRRYLPANYAALQHGDATIYVIGEDRSGWTLDDYVIPRLSSGLHFARELKDETNLTVVREAVGALDRAYLIGAAQGLDAFPFGDLDGGPGRLDGCADRELCIALDVLVGHGDGEEVGGDIETSLHGVRFGRFLLTTDTRGFLDVETFEDEAGAVARLSELEAVEPHVDDEGFEIR